MQMSMRSALAHLPIPFLAMGILLSACQPRPAAKSAAESVADLTPADPEPPLAAPAEPAAPAAAVPEAFAGRWFVSAVYPVGTARASLGDRHLGTSLVIGASEVSDINGQRCVVPELVADRNPGDLRFGTAQLGDVERLTVTCKGKSFATYLLLPGRKLDASYQSADAPGVPYALLADRPEGQYLLERAEQVLHRQASLQAVSAGDGVVPVVSPKKAEPGAVAKPFVPQPAAPTLNAPLALTPEPPVPVTAPEPAPAPAVAAVNPAPAATGKAAKADAVAATEGSVLPASGTAIHLASYQGISAAKRGWKTLLGEFDALDPLSPLYVDVDVAGKGRMVRLYATGGDRKTLDTACTALLAKGAYCVLSR
jgi:hypothetical protein